MRPDMVLETLQGAGFEAWYVGGCVRDTLLGRPIHDWDVTTSALPEQIQALFPRTVPTGLRHGTVTVLSEAGPVEVTTYRADGAYHDGRHPDGVRFVRSLREDTARRDFTVNAMAMDQYGALRDFHGGRADLTARVLRCVGEPERRFREDALRMLRACRFAAQLGFSIEPDTWAALLRCAPLCASLSRERITEELTKTLCSPAPQWVGTMSRAGLLAAVGLGDVPDLTPLAALPPAAEIRWAGFALLLPDPSPDPSPLAALPPAAEVRRAGSAPPLPAPSPLAAVRLPAKLVRLCRAARRHWPPPADRLGWKRLIAAEGREFAGLLAALARTDLVADILASGECVCLRELAVSGRDFPALRGPALGRLLNDLLDHVLQHPADNERRTLLTLADALEISS